MNDNKYPKTIRQLQVYAKMYHKINDYFNSEGFDSYDKIFVQKVLDGVNEEFESLDRLYKDEIL